MKQAFSICFESIPSPIGRLLLAEAKAASGRQGPVGVFFLDDVPKDPSDPRGRGGRGGSSAPGVLLDLTLAQLARRYQGAEIVPGACDSLRTGLRRYFDQALWEPVTSFDFLAGTPFQLKVWKEIAKIPQGRFRTYGDIARAAGSPEASRAAGQATGRNPVGILIPCHRVVGAGGSLTGYGGGLWRKKWLLDHEGGVLRLTGGS